MKWNHILDNQPEDGSIIIQLDKPYEGYKGDFKYHYAMGMRQYNTYGYSLEQMKANNEKYGIRQPDFWWVYAKDFPFPQQPKDDE